MSQELDGKRNSREPRKEEESSADLLRAKAKTYALVNRPSPPF